MSIRMFQGLSLMNENECMWLENVVFRVGEGEARPALRIKITTHDRSSLPANEHATSDVIRPHALIFIRVSKLVENRRWDYWRK